MTEQTKTPPQAGDMILVMDGWGGRYELYRVVKPAKEMWQLELWRWWSGGGWGDPSRKRVTTWLPVTGDPVKIQSKLGNYQAQKNHAFSQAKDQYAYKVQQLSELGA